ncbi:MAG: flagellin lysine-N-methylase [Pseudomonadota bacterium]
MQKGPQKPPVPHRSLRAVKEFNCLGGDCPDTCCKSWRIELDRDDYMRWRKAAKGSAETLALFKDSVKRVRGAEKIFAQIKIEKHGDACPAYTADGLCQVQKNHGHKTIPYICQLYPRTPIHVGQSVVNTGSFSCPELARTLLLTENGTDIVEHEESYEQSFRAMRRLPRESQGNWLNFQPEIAEACRFLASESAEGRPLDQRLFMVAMLLDSIDAINPDIDLYALSRCIAPFGDAAYRAEAANVYCGLDVSATPVATQLIYTVFAAAGHADRDGSAPFWADITACYQHLAGVKMSVGKDAVMNMQTSDVLVQAVQARRTAVAARFGARLDTVQTRFMKTQLFADTEDSDRDPVQCFLRHISLLLLFDFAVCSHRALDDTLQKAEADIDDADWARFDEVVVESAYKLGRVVLHQGPTIEKLNASLANQSMSLLALIATLLKHLDATPAVEAADEAQVA